MNGDDPLDEKQAVKNQMLGSTCSIQGLINDYKDRLYGLCIHLEKSRFEADELYQDTWLKVIEKVDRFDTTRNFWPWLAKIAVNTYRDRYRRIKRWLTVSTNSENFEENNTYDQALRLNKAYDTPEKLVEDNEFKVILTKCLNKLDDKYRIPLLLHYYRDMSYEDIAAAIGIKLGTVKSRLNEAKKRLRKIVEVAYDER